MMELIELTKEDQILAAKAFYLVEDNEPDCPTCGCGVLRPKCYNEYPYDECPRHAIADSIHEILRGIGKLVEMPDGWRYRAKLSQVLRAPSDDEREVLETVKASPGYVVATPRRMENFYYGPVLTRCLSLSHYENLWRYSLNIRGIEYCEFHKIGG